MAARFNSLTGGNWNNNNSWSATNGGAGPASFPVLGDDVNITGSGGNIAVNVSSACTNFTKTGATLTGSSALAVAGSFSFAGASTYTGTITYNSTTTGQTLTFNGSTLASNLIFNGVGGGWTQVDALATSGTWTLTNGAYSDNGQTATASSFSSSNTNTRAITKTARWTATGTGTVMNFAVITGLSATFSGGWNLTNSSGTARTVATGGLTFGDVFVQAGTMIQNFTGAGAVGDLDFTGFSGSWASANLTVNGDLKHSATMTVTAGGQTTTLTGAKTGTSTITSNGVQTRGLILNAPGATVQLADALDLGSGRFTHTAGDFRTQNKAVTFDNGISASGITRGLYFGSSLVTVTGFVSGSNFAWSVASAGLTLDAGTSTFKFTDASATNKIINFGGFTYNVVWIAPGAGSGQWNLQTGGVFAQLKDDGSAAHTLAFSGGSPYSVADWQVSGSPGNLISLVSLPAGTPVSITKTGGGNVLADYLSVTDVKGFPGYSWFVGPHSVNVGSNNRGIGFCTARVAAAGAAMESA
jgi:hypothetical protein